jgi:hypothetical protein
MTTLVIDTGQNIVGIFSVEEDAFAAYRGSDMGAAAKLVQTADEVVTYHGSVHDGWSDLVKLGQALGIPDGLPLNGIHTDMRTVCWSDRIMGSSLANTYKKQFGDLPVFPDTHEGSCESDVHMTFKLWEAWKQGKLRIIDGNEQ